MTSLHNEDDIGLHGIEPRMVDDGFKLEGVGDDQQAARDHLKPVSCSRIVSPRGVRRESLPKG